MSGMLADKAGPRTLMLSADVLRCASTAFIIEAGTITVVPYPGGL